MKFERFAGTRRILSTPARMHASCIRKRCPIWTGSKDPPSIAVLLLFIPVIGIIVDLRCEAAVLNHLSLGIGSKLHESLFYVEK